MITDDDTAFLHTWICVAFLFSDTGTKGQSHLIIWMHMSSCNTRQAYQNCYRGAHIGAFQLPDLILGCLHASLPFPLSCNLMKNCLQCIRGSVGPHDQLLPLQHLSFLSLLHEWGPSGPGQSHVYLHIPSFHLVTCPLEDRSVFYDANSQNWDLKQP